MMTETQLENETEGETMAQGNQHWRSRVRKVKESANLGRKDEGVQDLGSFEINIFLQSLDKREVARPST